jgi:hypothetical protein
VSSVIHNHERWGIEHGRHMVQQSEGMIRRRPVLEGSVRIGCEDVNLNMASYRLVWVWVKVSEGHLSRRRCTCYGCVQVLGTNCRKQ